MIATTRRWWALAALTVAVLAVGLDATVLNLALPTLAAALHASETELQWFVAGYSLALAAALLPAGLLGDRFGRKTVLLVALVLFGVGSVACAYASSSTALVVARVALGVGAAFVVTLSLSALTVLFTPEERPRAVGIWAAANFLALPIGPLLGGWLLSRFWWGWVFLINIPVIALALIAVALLLPQSRSSERPGLDLPGVLASSAGLAGMTYGLIRAGQKGWGDVGALAFLVTGLAVLLAFGFWERALARRPGGQPLVDLDLFGQRSFTWGTILGATGILAMFTVLFVLPQYFEAVLGLDAQGAGLRLLPLIGGIVVGAGLADRAAARMGAGLTAALGFVVLAGAAAAGATTALSSSQLFAAAWIALSGAGVGLALATAASAALGQLSEERSGVGSALMQAVQKVGGPLGVAVLGSVLNSVYEGNLHLTGLPAQAAAAVQRSVFAGVAVAQQLHSAPLLDSVRAAFIAGMDAMLWVGCGIALAGALLALAFLPRRVAPSAESRQPEAVAEASHVRP